jgi:Ca-activated chloride channel homolog
MQRTALSLASATLVIAGCWFQPAVAQERAEGVFRSSVDLVSVTAVVRDRHGRVVRSLNREDFEVLEGGRTVPILDLQADDSSPATVALLIDGSGSMRLRAALAESRRISETVLRGLQDERDTAALFSFDTRLLTLRDFTSDLNGVRDDLDRVDAWGSTSLYDAIAGAAGVVANRASSRRAVIVFTDGADTTSAYSPDEVAVIASSIDVPVYVFALGEGGANADTIEAANEESDLAGLARATGGELFTAGSEAQVVAAVARVLDELRHQYVFAFNGADAQGMRRVEIRTRQPKLKVTSRKWYLAGSGD